MPFYRRPNADLVEGSEVTVPCRPHWNVCTVVDARDPSILRIYVPAVDRELLIGRAAVHPTHTISNPEEHPQ